ncbi:phosphoglycolate phosphatase [Rhodobacterales bacterium 59_46_T64]|nr:phosphoglycolate phosphatase [Rhodobacterales bacterium 59_46_T64]
MARIVFDLDGTLIDSAPDLHGIGNQLLEADGHAPISLADTRAFVGNGAAVFVKRMRAARGIADAEQTRLLAAFLRQYEQAVELTKPYEGVVSALTALARAGHRLGICTNKPIAPTRAVLNDLDLAGFFEVVLGGDSLALRKPDPAPLHAAFQALGAGPQIYVGDSEVDAQTAQRAAVPFLLFTEGYRRSSVADIAHHAAFSDFARLPDLVRQTLAGML